VADVRVGERRYALNGTPTANGTSFDVSLKTVPLPPGGAKTSTVTFRLCTSADCSTVYPSSTKTFTVNLDVRLRDWATFQRNAAHDGYVPASYDTADFRNIWNFDSRPAVPTEIAARRGTIFVNVGFDRSPRTVAIDSANGDILWTHALASDTYGSPPSYTNGRVAVMTGVLTIAPAIPTPRAVPLQILSADDGTALGTIDYISDFPFTGAPTPIGDNIYFQAGLASKQTLAFDLAGESQLWERITSEVTGESPAADDSYVYFFGGENLFVLSRDTGAIASTISNPYFDNFTGGYAGAPILGAGRIFTFAHARGPQQPLPLAAFSLSSPTALWRTAGDYVGHPALRDDTLFAIRANSAVIDMISTADGSVTGSIDLGSSAAPLTSNVIVTGSHLFVASDSATYAIDLKQTTHPVVWSVPKGGALAITPDNILVISAIDGLVAYELAP
jgi:outer membrane protein assembly factor BamB